MNSSVIELVRDDRAYLKWLSQHPSGFVLNTQKSKIPNYMVLHRAWCL